jgi:hypothetical protein
MDEARASGSTFLVRNCTEVDSASVTLRLSMNLVRTAGLPKPRQVLDCGNGACGVAALNFASTVSAWSGAFGRTKPKR